MMTAVLVSMTTTVLVLFSRHVQGLATAAMGYVGDALDRRERVHDRTEQRKTDHRDRLVESVDGIDPSVFDRIPSGRGPRPTVMDRHTVFVLVSMTTTLLSPSSAT
jgi:hypothetical protein